MPEINGPKDCTHYFVGVSPNVVVENFRGVCATRKILNFEPLILSTTKGVPLDDFVSVVAIFRKFENCDIRNRESVTKTAKPAENYTSYVKTVVQETCSVRQI